jgi:hypothetical protein
VKLFYSYTKEELEEIEKMQELCWKLLNDKISKEEFEGGMSKLTKGQPRLV